ncbi:MAG: amidohydrolase family protein [Dehalococcoidia bacterium]
MAGEVASAVIRQVGADRFVWASDYPHSEGHADLVRTVKETLSGLPEGNQRKILGENTIGLYDLSG